MTRSGRVRASTTRVLKSSGRVQDGGPKIMPTIPNATSYVDERDGTSNHLAEPESVQLKPADPVNPSQQNSTPHVEDTQPVQLEADPVINRENPSLDVTLSDLCMKRGRGPAKGKSPVKAKAKSNSPVKAKAKAKSPVKAKAKAKSPVKANGTIVIGGKGRIGGGSSSSTNQTRINSNSPPLESAPVIASENISQGGGLSSHSNTNTDQPAEDSIANPPLKMVSISSEGLEPSKECSEAIFRTFKHEFDPKGINWKSLSKNFKDFYFGEFKKVFCWDPSIDESVVRKLWERKAAARYRDLVSKVKTNKIPVENLIPVNILNSWRILWADDNVVERSKVNAKNRRGGKECAIGTHTGGSITLGEHSKRLADKMGRPPTPYELHVHVHTQHHDGKSFLDDRSKDVHEKYKEIVQQQSESQTKVDEVEAFAKAAAGHKRRKIHGFIGSHCNSSSSTEVSNDKLDELVTRLVPLLTERLVSVLTERLIPALTEHLVPILTERVAASISSSRAPPAAVPPASDDELWNDLS